MSDLETKNLPAADADTWQQQCAALQKQITTLLLGLVIVSGTLSIFLWRQSRYARVDLTAAKEQSAAGLQVFKQQEKPAMDAFEVKLADFGRTHPDLVRMLGNYKIQLPPVPATPPGAAPKAAPVAPVAPPKK